VRDAARCWCVVVTVYISVEVVGQQFVLQGVVTAAVVHAVGVAVEAVHVSINTGCAFYPCEAWRMCCAAAHGCQCCQ
jgi:hypothetical protein